VLSQTESAVCPQARELAMVLWATAAVGGPSQDLLAAAGREVMRWQLAGWGREITKGK
jgi:hypothetical protein